MIDERTAAAIEREAAAEIERGGRVRARQPVPGPELALDSGLRANERRDETTFVEAINDTLARAMREDERVIVLGEDVAEGGPYLATAGLAEEFGARARAQHADQRGRGVRRGDRRGAGGAAGRSSRSCSSTSSRWRSTSSSTRRPRRTSCPGGQLYGAARAAHPGRRRAAQRRPALAEPRGVAHPRARAEGRHAEQRGRRGRAAAQRDRRSEPGGVRREQVALLPARDRSPTHPQPVPLGRRDTLRAGTDVTIVALSRLVGDAIEAAERLAATTESRPR